MAINTRRALLATRRGTIVKRSVLAFGLLAVGLTILSNQTGGHPVSTTTATTSVVAKSVVVNDPIVEAYVANPFAAQQGSYYQTGGGGSAAAAVTGAPNAATPTSAPGVNETVVVRQMAQQFAVSWATHSHSQSPAAFLAQLPGIAPDYVVPITGQVTASWTSMVANEDVAVGSLTGETPQVQVFDAQGGKAAVAVTVDQDRTLASGGTTTTRVSYVVNLVRYLSPATGSSAATSAWGVSGIIQN